MSIQNKINVAVIGATGYTGLELVYLLTKHPKVIIKYLCATKKLGSKINYFDQRIKKKLPRISSIKKIDWKTLDVIFLSLPNGESQKIINKTFKKYKNLNYIDLSADFRLKKISAYYENYRLKHKAQHLIKNSLYSVSEFNRNKIKNYRIIANPGCYATSVQLALMPLFLKNLIQRKDITIDSKSGYSGAGKKLDKKFKHKNLYSSTYAYSIKHHRHMSEIDQEFEKAINKKIEYTFNPHLLPTFRGILSSIYIKPKKGVSINAIRNELIKFYKNSKFIKIKKLNSQLGSGNVLNTNNCEISVCQTNLNNRIIIFSALDNLIKGASGQAIQNMNLMFNLSESMGLK